MSRFRLYAGLVRDGKWFNYAEIKPIKSGALALLDSNDKSGASRLISLLKNYISSLYTEEGEEYICTPADYNTIKVCDSWKIAYEALKCIKKEEYVVIPESFFCERCSLPEYEKYTDVEESWQELVDKGLIDEIYSDNPDTSYEVELPEPIVIEPNRTIAGGTFKKIRLDLLTLSDILKIQKNPVALKNELNMLYANIDLSIVEIPGLSERDFNIIMRTPDKFFSEKYLSSDENIEALNDAIDMNYLGFDASDRKIICKYCGNEIGGSLDFTNFFSIFYQRKSSQERKGKRRGSSITQLV